MEISAEHNNLVDLVFYQSDDGKYYVQYEFLKAPNGKHIEFLKNMFGENIWKYQKKHGKK